MSRKSSSGIHEYTRSLIDSILEHDKINQYEFFYNGWNKIPLPANWSGENRKIHSSSWPNKLFDISSRFFGYPQIGSGLNPDLIFSPHFNILRHDSRIPRVVTVHDLSFVHHPDFFSTRHRFWHWLQDLKSQINRAARVIADSDFTKSDLVNTLGIAEDKVVKIYPGIGEGFGGYPQDSNDTREILEKYGIQRPYILFLGTIEPRKNVIAIVRAFEILKRNRNFNDLHLALAGSLGWLSRDVSSVIRNSANRESIRLTGQVASDERARLYRGAAAFVYPSFFEGFGFPPLEAQACGTPVIASNRTSLPEILGTSALLVDPWRTGDLARAIQLVLEDRELKRELMEKGLKNVQRFSWQKTAREVIRVFEEAQ